MPAPHAHSRIRCLPDRNAAWVAPRCSPRRSAATSRSCFAGAVGSNEPMEFTMQSTELTSQDQLAPSGNGHAEGGWALESQIVADLGGTRDLDEGNAQSRQPAKPRPRWGRRFRIGLVAAAVVWAGLTYGAPTCGSCSRPSQPTTPSSRATSPTSAPGSRASSPRCSSTRTTGSSRDSSWSGSTASRSRWPSPRRRRRWRRPARTSRRPGAGQVADRPGPRGLLPEEERAGDTCGGRSPRCSAQFATLKASSRARSWPRSTSGGSRTSSPAARHPGRARPAEQHPEGRHRAGEGGVGRDPGDPRRARPAARTTRTR